MTKSRDSRKWCDGRVKGMNVGRLAGDMSRERAELQVERERGATPGTAVRHLTVTSKEVAGSLARGCVTQLMNSFSISTLLHS